MIAPLFSGLALFGLGEGLLVLSHLGATPWTVFAQGVAKHAGISLGWATALISVAVLTMWWPLRERPGFGTVSNLVVIALVLDLTATSIPAPSGEISRWLFVAGAVIAIGMGSALYLTTGLGPGPRDGLMTSLHRRLGVSVVYVRVTLEVAVLAIGWFMGGTVGLGTAVFAGTIGFSIGVWLQGLEWILARATS
ncbi:MAG: hypothetical protein KGJ92_06590 [Actinomycetales bacterium]|nr:hypothetical protein [Actinomycetales bacterium]